MASGGTGAEPNVGGLGAPGPPSAMWTAVSALALGETESCDAMFGCADNSTPVKPKPAKPPSQSGDKETGKKTAGAATRVCRLCSEEKMKKEFTGTKACCKLCFKHFEAARRDAIKQQELAFFNQINEDDELLRDFMHDWLEHTPPAKGAGHKRGGYKFARFVRRVEAKKGVLAQRKKVMKTKKQFVTAMKERGKEKQWAEREFNRRLLGGTEWKIGLQCWGDDEDSSC